MKDKYHLLLAFVISLIVCLNGQIANAKTHLTFTAHPTNTKMGKENFSTHKEIDYYYDNLLINLPKVILSDTGKYLDEIGGLYSWIVYDFDRSNLTAKDISYANIKGMNIMLNI